MKISRRSHLHSPFNSKNTQTELFGPLYIERYKKYTAGRMVLEGQPEITKTRAKITNTMDSWPTYLEGGPSTNEI